MAKNARKSSKANEQKRYKLIQWRLHANLTQEQVASHFKVHPQTIGRHERGELELTNKWLNDYAKLYGCKAADLLDDSEETKQRQANLYGYLGADYKITKPKKEEAVALNALIPAGELGVVKVQEDIFPLFRKGDLILIDLGKEFTPKLCMNRQCIIEVTSHTTMLGIFKRGNKSNHYSIFPISGSPLEDKKILTAYPVKAILKN